MTLHIFEVNGQRVAVQYGVCVWEGNKLKYAPDYTSLRFMGCNNVEYHVTE